MKNLFIDTNIWLSLYTFSQNNLDQFGKLEELLGVSINLIVPQQVKDELIRNRENKIKEALENFEFKSPVYPVFATGYTEYSEINKNIKNVEKSFNNWKEKIETDIKNRCLPADTTIKQLFQKTPIIQCDSFIDAAYTRYRKGNPPGKNNKYGDAINWVCLLNSVNNGEDLYFISGDKDYKSLFDNSMNEFLVEEWERLKHSKIFFYTKLVDFINEHVKEIRIQAENEKNQHISALIQSANFSQTHYIISLLNNYSDWNDQQIEALCTALMTNGQVYWIKKDPDVTTFYTDLLSKVDYNKISGYTKQAWETYRTTAEAAIREAYEGEIAEQARMNYEDEVAEAQESFYEP